MIRFAWRRRVFSRAISLCLAAGAAGALSNAVRDRDRLAWTPGVFPPVEREIRPLGIGVVRHDVFEQARLRGGIVVDARSGTRYRDGHIPGAISIPAYEDFAVFLNHAATLVEADWIGVYGADPFSGDGAEVARMLGECGLARVHLYVGGYADWRARRKPAAPGDPP